MSRIVRPLLIFGLVAMAVLPASAAEPARRVFTVNGFDRIEVGGAYRVEVRVGPGASVRAEGDRDTLDRMLVEVRGTRLLIRPSQTTWRADRNEGPAVVFVALPALRGVTVDGAGQMRVDKVRGTDFAASVTGAGTLEVGEVTADRVALTMAGAGKLSVAGKAETVRVDMMGAGAIDAGALAAQSLTATVSGTGGLNAAASREAALTVAGAADVVVTGTARCKVTQMGAGTVRCGA